MRKRASRERVSTGGSGILLCVRLFGFGLVKVYADLARLSIIRRVLRLPMEVRLLTVPTIAGQKVPVLRGEHRSEVKKMPAMPLS